MKDRHTLDGKVYRELKKSTIAHDLWVNDKIRASGLNKLEKGPDEEWGDYGVRVTESVLNSGVALLLLGGLLIPDEIEDLRWRPETAIATAEALAGISEPDEKTKVHVLIGNLVMGFFVDGVLEAKTSRSSFAPPTALSGSSATEVN